MSIGVLNRQVALRADRYTREVAIVCVAALFCWTGIARVSAQQIRFEDVSKTAGIEELPRSKHPDPAIASGRRDYDNVYAQGYFREIRDLTFADVDGDGNLDIFLLDGQFSLWSRLWLGDGHGGFKEVPKPAEDIDIIVGEATQPFNYWRVLPFDYGGHGVQSLVVSGSGGDGRDAGGSGAGSRRLTMIPKKAGASGDLKMRAVGLESAGFGVLLGDFDSDGVIDTIMGARLDRSGNSAEGTGRLVCGMRINGQIEWDRTWSAMSAGVGDVTADFDNDGRADVLCRGQWQKTRLFHNDGNRRFHDVTSAAGLEILPSGGPIAVADFFHEGRLSIFAGGVLMRNLGDGSFKDVTADSGLKKIAGRSGMAIAEDFDNDGWVDLLVCDGDRLRVFRNLGNGKFEDETEKAGLPAKITPLSSVAAGDYDMDGRVDALYVTADRGAGLLHNLTANENGWINIKLSGPAGNPEAAGARITIYEAGKLGDQKAILGCQQNIFASDFKMARPMHFGLGSQKACDIRVIFPGGKVVDKSGAATGQVIHIAIGD